MERTTDQIKPTLFMLTVATQTLVIAWWSGTPIVVQVKQEMAWYLINKKLEKSRNVKRFGLLGILWTI